jgi:hypothetical protein
MKALLSVCLVLFAFLGFAQGVKSTTAAMNGVTVANVDIYNTSGADALSIQTVATEVGGTSDGTITLQVSNDGSNFVTVTDAILIGAHDDGITFVSDSIHTVTDGSVWALSVKEPSWYIYRLVCAGTVNDTTSVEVSWKFNK